MKQKTFSHKSGAVLTLVLVLFFCSTLQAQIYTNINTYGYNWNRGDFLLNLSPPNDTIQPPVSKLNKPHIAIKGDSLYLWSVFQQKYILYNSGSGGGPFVPTSRTLTINGTTSDFSDNGKWNLGLQEILDQNNTATSDMALTGTLGIDGKFSLAHQLSSPFTPSAGFGYLYYFDDSLRFKTPTTTFVLGRGDGGSVVHQNLSNTALLANGDYTSWWSSYRLKIVGFDQLDLHSDTVSNGNFGIADWKTSKGLYIYGNKSATAGSYAGPKDSVFIAEAFNADSLSNIKVYPGHIDFNQNGKKIVIPNVSGSIDTFAVKSQFLPIDISDFVDGDVDDLYVTVESGDTIIKVREAPTGGSSTDTLLTGAFTVTASGDTVYPNNGDSIIISDDFVGNHILSVTKDTTYLPNRATYGYTISSDTLTFHPPLVTGQKVEVKLWKGAQRSISFTPYSGGGGGGGGGTENIVFTTVTSGFADIGSNVWQGTNMGSNWLNYGVTTKVLDAGNNGWIQFKYDAGNTQTQKGILGFKTASSNGDFSTLKFGVYTPNGFISYIDNGSVSGTGVQIFDEQFMRIDITGSAAKIQLIDVDGTTILNSSVYTFSTTRSTDLYIGGNTDADGKITIPTGNNLSNP